MTQAVTDTMGRPLRDLRISVTDRCNLRCSYCMPAEVFGADYAFLPREAILSFEEIERIVRVMSGLGVRKVRFTGGEPLLRRDLAALVRNLAAISDLEDLALTTNGLLLGAAAADLRRAGLHRVTVSVDALDDDLYRRMSGGRGAVADVLAELAVAREAGLPVKINCVIQRGVNESEILPLAEFCRSEGFTLRFIEYMDVGNHNRWDPASVVPAREIMDILDQEFGVAPLESGFPGEVAKRYRYLDGQGEVGLVASITQPFCRDCNRVRLTADGKLVTCLFASGGADVRAELRKGESDAELAAFIRGIWEGRSDRYSELRAAPSTSPAPKIEMSYVGG
jgi:cyclic pyranopterin phosphate synthase